jgi:hypothetical protein
MTAHDQRPNPLIVVVIDESPILAVALAKEIRDAPVAGVIPPFLRGFGLRIYAAIFSFCAGVIPPFPRLGRSWL